MLLNCGAGEDSWESLGQQGDQSWIFTGRTDAEADASNILPEQRQKINLFPGTIAIVTIFTLNLYILACLCFIMFAVVHTMKPFLDNLPVFGPTSPILIFFLMKNGYHVFKIFATFSMGSLFFVYLPWLISPDRQLIFRTSLSLHHYKLSLFTSVWICYTSV